MAERVLLLSVLAFACLYGAVQLYRGYHRKYFSVAFCGTIALFLSRLYYLVLYLSDGNDSILTVGTLGQASAYLFFAAGNLTFLSHRFSAKIKEKICPPAVIGVSFCTLALAAAAIRFGTLSAYIGDAIYVISMGIALYLALAAMCWRRELPVCGYVFGFNLCICILIVLNVLQEFVFAFSGGIIQTVLLWILLLISLPTLAGMLPLLKRGMRAWHP